jgi:ankyrin repeat protein
LDSQELQMTTNNSHRHLTAAEVLQRYKDEDLPAFVEITLEDVNQVGNFGERPLHVASVRGNMDEVAALIHAGADVNAPGDLSNTPLHEAIGQGHVGVIKFLLDHGATPSAKNEFGQTPLDIARLNERYDIVKLLQDRMDNPVTDGT